MDKRWMVEDEEQRMDNWKKWTINQPTNSTTEEHVVYLYRHFDLVYKVIETDDKRDFYRGL